MRLDVQGKNNRHSFEEPPEYPCVCKYHLILVTISHYLTIKITGKTAKGNTRRHKEIFSFKRFTAKTDLHHLAGKEYETIVIPVIEHWGKFIELLDKGEPVRS